MATRKGTKAWRGMVHVDKKKEQKKDPEREQQFEEYFEAYKKQSLRSAVLHDWTEDEDETIS